MVWLLPIIRKLCSAGNFPPTYLNQTRNLKQAWKLRLIMKTEADDDDGAVRVGSFVPWILLKLLFTGILFFGKSSSIDLCPQDFRLKDFSFWEFCFSGFLFPGRFLLKLLFM